MKQWIWIAREVISGEKTSPTVHGSPGGESFPGAISFWTPYGLRQYLRSGLCQWHVKPVEVLFAGESSKVLYRDAFQVSRGGSL